MVWAATGFTFVLALSRGGHILGKPVLLSLSAQDYEEEQAWKEESQQTMVEWINDPYLPF